MRCMTAFATTNSTQGNECIHGERKGKSLSDTYLDVKIRSDMKTHNLTVSL